MRFFRIHSSVLICLFSFLLAYCQKELPVEKQENSVKEKQEVKKPDVETRIESKKELKKDRSEKVSIDTKPPTIPQRIFVLKRLPDGKISKIETKSKDVVIKINQIVTKGFPKIQLYVSVTNKDGQPVELANTDIIFLEENGKLVPKNQMIDIRQQKNKETLAPLNLVLAIDKSGSMAYDGKVKAAGAEQPIEFAKKAAIDFIEKMNDKDNIQVIAFDGDIHYLDENHYAVKHIRNLEANGSTALYAALYHSVSKIKYLGGIRAVILMTDGKNDLRSNFNPALEKISLGKGLEQARIYSIPVFTIGFGKAADRKTLQTIADDTHSIYFSTDKKEELTNLYEGIRHIINNQYVISYNTNNFEKSTQVKIMVFSESDYRTYINFDDLLVKAAKLKEKLKAINEKEQELITLRKQLLKKEKEYNTRLLEMDSKEQTAQKRLAAMNKAKKELDSQKKKFEDYVNTYKQEMTVLEKGLKKMKINLDKRKLEIENEMKYLLKKNEQYYSKKKELASKEKKLAVLGGELNQKNQKIFSNQKELSLKEINLVRVKIKLENESGRLIVLQQGLKSEERALAVRTSSLINAKERIAISEKELKRKFDQLGKAEKLYKQDYEKFIQDKEQILTIQKNVLAKEEELIAKEKKIAQERQQLEQDKAIYHKELKIFVQEKKQLDALNKTLKIEKAKTREINRLLKNLLEETKQKFLYIEEKQIEEKQIEEKQIEEKQIKEPE